ncbi:MAG TPA: hypothetical protein PKH39_16560 [Woeseiaceae bacterium]|nr:hypothetical protein [Woeseiaceae bacterium]
MRISAIATATLVVLAMTPSIAQPRGSFVEVDENLWVTFYDVPSHRFRSIRDAFVRRDFDAVRRDLVTSASHLTIESGRSSPELADRLADVGQQMLQMSDNLDGPEVTAELLDKLFGRTHWLLAQHYLYHARISRDANNNSMAGRYLWATTHHMERAALWSDSRISRKLVNSLEELRDLAVQLQDRQLAAAARQEKPVARAEAVLQEIGRQIDRPVVLKIK